MLGFVIPVFVLLNFVFKGYAVFNLSEVFQITSASLDNFFISCIFIMLVSFFLIVVSTYKLNNFQKILISFLASCGYAFPGTILALE